MHARYFPVMTARYLSCSTACVSPVAETLISTFIKKWNPNKKYVHNVQSSGLSDRADQRPEPDDRSGQLKPGITISETFNSGLHLERVWAEVLCTCLLEARVMTGQTLSNDRDFTISCHNTNQTHPGLVCVCVVLPLPRKGLFIQGNDYNVYTHPLYKGRFSLHFFFVLFLFSLFFARLVVSDVTQTFNTCCYTVILITLA